MNRMFLSPVEISEEIIKTSVKKANLSYIQIILLGIFAGMFVGFGAHGAITVMQKLGNIDIGLAKFMGAFVFPVGLMLVLMAGGELFTGNNLMTLGFLNKRITLKQMLTNWILVYIGNFIGSVLLAVILSETGLYEKDTMAKMSISIATGKLSLGFYKAFLRAILCNIIVVLAVWMAAGAKDIVSKIFAVWFPIMLFVLSGFEHSVANMFFIPLAKFTGLDVTWGQIWQNNLIPVTLGNIVGGALIVPIVYYLTYVRNNSSKKIYKISS